MKLKVRDVCVSKVRKTRKVLGLKMSRNVYVEESERRR